DCCENDPAMPARRQRSRRIPRLLIPTDQFFVIGSKSKNPFSFRVSIDYHLPNSIALRRQMDETSAPRTRLKTIVVFAMLFIVFGAVVVFAFLSTFSRPLTTVILVRHAEKKLEPENPDPDLTPEGVARAQEIARVFGDAGINAIYATQYKRTQQTVKPLADRIHVPVTLLNSKQTDELVNQIQTLHRGQTIFVAGHSN